MNRQPNQYTHTTKHNTSGSKSNPSSIQSQNEQEEKFPSCLSSEVNFDDPSLPISSGTRDCAARMCLTKLSTIQAATIPRLFAGDHLIARASTGSGKTLAFTIGMLNAVDRAEQYIQCLCVAPVREIASQIHRRWVEPFAAAENITSSLVVPSDKSHGSLEPKRRAAQIIVGTPGIILNSLTAARGWPPEFRRAQQTVKMLVLDEADAFLSSGETHEQSQTISLRNVLGPDIQVACFSATFPHDVKDLVGHLLRSSHDAEGQRRSVAKLATEPEPLGQGTGSIKQARLDLRDGNVTIDHLGALLTCSSPLHKKVAALMAIYNTVSISRSIVFANRRDECEFICQELTNIKYSVSFTHGGLGPEGRDEEIRKFEAGETNVLVCTCLDRGIDIPEVSLVINFNVPVVRSTGAGDMVQFVHRIGRCSRWGKPGTALTLVASDEEARALEEIEEAMTRDRGMTETFAAGMLKAMTPKGPDPSAPITEGSTVAGAFRGVPNIQVMGRVLKLVADGGAQVSFKFHAGAYQHLRGLSPPQHRVSGLWVGAGVGVKLQTVVEMLSEEICRHEGSNKRVDKVFADEDGDLGFDEALSSPAQSSDGTPGPGSVPSSTPLRATAQEFKPSFLPVEGQALATLSVPSIPTVDVPGTPTVDEVTDGMASVSVEGGNGCCAPGVP